MLGLGEGWKNGRTYGGWDLMSQPSSSVNIDELIGGDMAKQTSFHRSGDLRPRGLNKDKTSDFCWSRRTTYGQHEQEMHFGFGTDRIGL